MSLAVQVKLNVNQKPNKLPKIPINVFDLQSFFSSTQYFQSHILRYKRTLTH